MSGGTAIATRLESALTPILEGLGLELYQVTYGRQHGGVVAVYIDRPEGVGLADCERTDRAIAESGAVDDIVTGSYVLEVSSPGLERPLLKPEHYERFLGKNIIVKTHVLKEGRRKFTGRLAGAREDSFDIECEDGPVTIGYGDVARTRLVFQPE